MTPSMTMKTALFMLSAAMVSASAIAPAIAATPDSWARLDKASEAACLKAAGLADAKAGPPVRYSDKVMFDARVIDGTWPQPHMKRAKAKMLCLYNRKNKRVEVQELAVPPAPPPPVKDVWWRAEDIGGKGIVEGSEVTLMLGGDGKIGGRSGCNGYSANYQVEGESIKVLAPMIGTKMACAPSLMNQEQAYQKLVETAASFTVTPEGMLLVKSADGATSRFVRK
jgi:heat shock protein HslJ